MLSWSGRANSFAERLRLGLAVIHGEPKDVDPDDDGRNSPPPNGTEEVSLDDSITDVLPQVTPSKKGVVGATHG